MPQRRTAIKDLRRNLKHHHHNLDIKTDLKKTIKKFLTAAQAKKAEAPELLKTVYKKLDKAAKRHILPKQTASRRKSFYARALTAVKT